MTSLVAGGQSEGVKWSLAKLPHLNCRTNNQFVNWAKRGAPSGVRHWSGHTGLSGTDLALMILRINLDFTVKCC